MTDCNQILLTFASSQKRKVEASFSGGSVSSDGGLLFFQEVERSLKLSQRLAKILPDHRAPNKITHQQKHMIKQRLLSICAGYEDLNDQDELRHDILMQTLVGSSDPLASSPTLCRMENRGDRQTMLAMHQLLLELFIQKHQQKPPKELILDFDATDDLTHGSQEGSFYHGYYKHHCFLPLYVFCGSDPLCALLRPANTDGARGAWAALKILVKKLRQQWGNDLKITFRGDTGFMRPRMLTWCETNNVHYIIGYSKNPRLLKQSAELIKQSKLQYEQTKQKQRLFDEYQYQAGTWDDPRKIIMKAEHTQRGENNRYIVTTLEGDPQALYDEVYCGRGDMENRIKEQQLNLFADRTSCHHWWANQLRLLLSTFAYLIMDRFRTLFLAGTDWAKLQCGTLRRKLIKIGAVVTRNTRRVKVHLSSAYPYQGEFIKAYKQMMSG